ncbi:MAG: IS256 family transposase [Solirubrobacterales bacterium]
MSKRVSPTESVRAQIDALFDGSRELVEIIEDVARLGAQLIIQTAVEAEVTAFLGRARYERANGEQCGAGMRNGYQPPAAIKTTAGPVSVQRPKLRGTSEPFVSRLFGQGVTKSNALECLVIASFVRGLSVRDVEATLADALGVAGKVSKSEVSRICKAIGGELDAWSSRRLDDVRLDYLFLDGSYFKYHVGAAAEPVLAAWGIDTDGKPVFVGLAASGGGESGDGWADFLTELGERGLACPLLVVSDGAAGLIDAVERTMPAALRQRCLIHRCRNIVAEVPKHAQGDVKTDYWKIFDVADDVEPGRDAVALVQKRIDGFAARWRDSYPAAVKCLLTDRDSLTVYLRFPREHWTRVRHSNFIERTFGETRRRVKVIGRLPGETSCLSLVWAVLDRASRGWRGFTMTAAGLRLLQDLRRQLLHPPAALRSPAGHAAEHAETIGAVA